MRFRKNIKDKTNKRTYYGVSILFLIFVYFNPFSWVVYALMLGSILYLFLKGEKSELVIYGAVSYLLVASVISLSPYLQVKDFQLFHPTYQQTKEYTIIDYKYRSSGEPSYYRYVNIEYQYTVGGKEYKNIEKKVIKQYHFFKLFFNDKAEKRLIEFTENAINNKSLLVFVDKDNPAESRLFYSDQLFFLTGSFVYDYLGLVPTFLIFGFFLYGIFLLFFYLRKEDKKHKRGKWGFILKYTLVGTLLFGISSLFLINTKGISQENLWQAYLIFAGFMMFVGAEVSFVTSIIVYYLIKKRDTVNKEWEKVPGNYTIKDVGITIAERNNHSYDFYPYAMNRLLALLLFPVSYFIGFIFLFLKDFELNIWLVLYFAVLGIICLFLFYRSFKSVSILNGDTVVTIRLPFKKDEVIPIRHIRYIYRFTKTEIIPSGTFMTAWERNTRFYLYLNNEEKIILNKLIDEDSRRYFNKYRCVDKFDRLMSDLANDLDLEIVREEIKWEW